MARLLFDIEDLPPAAGRVSARPLLVRISGTGLAIRRICRLAAGPVDAAPVDFRAWAAGLAPCVRAGLDPRAIEAAVAADLTAAGLACPAEAVAMSSNHRQFRWLGQDGAAHGLCLPGWVIDPALSEQERRDAFLRMLTACQAETSGRPLPAGHGCERMTEFSLPRLLPLPLAESVPSWCGRDDPYRDSAKRQAWGTATGGLAQAMISVKPDGCLVVAGIFNRDCRYDGNDVAPFAALARRYDVAVEITAWGELTRMARDGTLRHRRVLRDAAVADAVAPYGLRGPDHLAGLFVHGRHTKALACLTALRSQLVHPLVFDWVSDVALAAAAAVALGDRLSGALRPARRRAAAAYRQTPPSTALAPVRDDAARQASLGPWGS